MSALLFIEGNHGSSALANKNVNMANGLFSFFVSKLISL